MSRHNKLDVSNVTKYGQIRISFTKSCASQDNTCYTGFIYQIVGGLGGAINSTSGPIML